MAAWYRNAGPGLGRARRIATGSGLRRCVRTVPGLSGAVAATGWLGVVDRVRLEGAVVVLGDPAGPDPAVPHPLSSSATTAIRDPRQRHGPISALAKPIPTSYRRRGRL
jgi:hypothetical protein